MANDIYSLGVIFLRARKKINLVGLILQIEIPYRESCLVTFFILLMLGGLAGDDVHCPIFKVYLYSTFKLYTVSQI